jgi:site-specific DNA-methyltransferase (adenine-specific)
MTAPYYEDDLVTLYLGDSLKVTPWLEAGVLVSDPPYGRAWQQGDSHAKHVMSDRHRGIAGDESTETRDRALDLWGTGRPALIFGDLMLAPPAGTKQVLVYRKPSNAGTRGCMGGYRRDLEAVYLVGKWASSLNARRSSLLSTKERTQGNPSSPQGRFGHPHAKPIDVMCELIRHTEGVIADPFAGSGSTLVAVKLLGRKGIGVELDEAHCEMAARRLAHDVLDFGEWEDAS